MKYYITKADEMVGPLEMKSPECWEKPIDATIPCPDCVRFENHLASLPKIKHRLPNKVGDIVEEGKDFEWDFTKDEMGRTIIGNIGYDEKLKDLKVTPELVAIPKEEKPKEGWVKGQNLELNVNGNDMRMSQAEVWHRDYGKFPTPGDRVVVTNVREDDGWIEIRCAHPNHIRQYWPPEYFKEPSAEENPVDESFTREDMIGFAEWLFNSRAIRYTDGGWAFRPIYDETYTSAQVLDKYLTNKIRNNGT